MKTKEQTLEEAKKYFDQYPKVETFYTTGDGNFFTPANKHAGNNHAQKEGKELITIHRTDIYPPVETQNVVSPDGDEIPDKKWKKDEISAWLADKEIEHDPESATKDDLLSLVPQE